jgi:hypothetical protein
VPPYLGIIEVIAFTTGAEGVLLIYKPVVELTKPEL